MHKLIIVEDEQSIKDGLIKYIPWLDYGFEIVGEANNGEEALKIIKEKVPDVVMTDIRMPKMDGIQLMELLRKEGNNVFMVVLSGYNDFEYARKALYFGASDYLLKPTNEKEIEKSFNRIKNELDMRKNKPFDKMQDCRNDFFKGVNYLPSYTNNQPTPEIVEKEINIRHNIINSVIELEESQIVPLTYNYMEFLAREINNVELIFIKVDELITELGVNLKVKGINLKEFCDDITLYNKISSNKTFIELSQWLKSFLIKVLGIVKSIGMFKLDPVIKKAMEYINTNITSRITLEDLSDIAYMNPVYFGRVFKQKTGKTVTEYIANLRIDKAKKLLTETDNKIYEIAENVGYDDFRHFCKVFKDKEGISPSAYRKER